MKKRDLFLGESYGHYRKGFYLKIDLQVEKEHSRLLDPAHPLILCALRHQEQAMAFVRVKIKKHRWFPHILKNQDPIIFSIGWRKFQSIPTFTTEDEDQRLRMIKYSPKFGHCTGVFYAPTHAVGTTFVGV